MTLTRDEFFQACLACDGEGHIYDSQTHNLSHQREIIIVRKCRDCHGTGKTLTCEGEAVLNLIFFKNE